MDNNNKINYDRNAKKILNHAEFGEEVISIQLVKKTKNG